MTTVAITKKLEKLEIRANKARTRLHEEKLKSNKKVANLGWGYGMRCVKMPTFTAEDNAKARLEKIENEIEELKLLLKDQK